MLDARNAIHRKAVASRLQEKLVVSLEDEGMVYEHFADSQNIDVSNLLTADLQKRCNELFGMLPIPFASGKGRLDGQVARRLDDLGATLPVLHVRGDIYLIGTKKLTLQH